MHPINANECDKDCAACASQNICNEETAARDGAEASHVAHQVTGEDGQYEREEVKQDALVSGRAIPALHDLRGCNLVDKVTAVTAGDAESNLASQYGACDDHTQTKRAVHISSCDHQCMAGDDSNEDLRHQ